MIKHYAGMKAEKSVTGEPLPKGGYVVKIEGARVEEYSWGSVLVVAIDVAEGEYAGFFRRQFDANLNEDKKWKGTFRLTIPDENSQYFASNKRVFNNFIYSLETSNNGYHFDWDETKLKGKFFGALYREKEFESNSGDIITTTECGGSTDIASIRSGDFRLPKDKLLERKPADYNAFANVPTDDDLPF